MISVWPGSMMRIYVEMSAEKTIELLVERHYSIALVKEMLQNERRLKYKGQVLHLHGSRTLADYNIEQGSTLHLELPKKKRPGMRIFVITPPPVVRMLPIEVESLDLTIAMLKTKI